MVKCDSLKNLTEIIDAICKCPEHEHSHIDPSLKPRVKSILLDSPNKLDIINGILDDAARYSLCSDFGMSVLNVLKIYIIGDGKNENS